MPGGTLQARLRPHLYCRAHASSTPLAPAPTTATRSGASAATALRSSASKRGTSLRAGLRRGIREELPTGDLRIPPHTPLPATPPLRPHPLMGLTGVVCCAAPGTVESVGVMPRLRDSTS